MLSSHHARHGVQYDRLIDALTRVLDQQPDNSTALNNRAIAFWEMGDLGQALRDLTDAIRSEPNAVPLMNRGDILRNLGHPSQAFLDYSAAIEIEPANPYFRRSRAHLLHQLGRFPEAVSDYDVAIRVQPEFQPTRSNHDRALAQQQLESETTSGQPYSSGRLAADSGVSPKSSADLP